MSSHAAVGELPPTDHVARVLLKRGARDQALALLRAAIQRDPGEKACAALLRAVEARPDASVYGPDLPLGIDLVEAYMRSGMFVEALAVLEGAGLGAEPAAAVRTRVLRQLLAPLPEDSDPQLREMDRQVRTGGASVALSMLDARAEVLPEWAQHRRALLQELLIDTAQPASRISTVSGAPPTVLGQALEGSLRTRDLRAVLSAARGYGAAHPEDGDVAGAIVGLERLVDAMAEVSGDMASTVLRTQPMTGHHVALFQLRMANLEVAERMFRKLVIDEPLDEIARQRLEDIQTVRAALSRPKPSELPLTLPSVAPHGPPNIDPLMETMSVSREDLELAGGDSRPVLTAVVLSPVEDDPDTVNTAVGRPTMEVTKPVHLSPLPRSLPNGAAPTGSADEWQEESSTDIGQPEHHAELLLKQGLADHALRIYESLVERFPNEGAYALRLHEIRAILERQRAARASSDSFEGEAIEGDSMGVEASAQKAMSQGPSASGPIWIGPLAGDSTDEPRQSGVLPAAADGRFDNDAGFDAGFDAGGGEVSGFGRTPAAGSGRAPVPIWEDDATTVEPVSDVPPEIALSAPEERDHDGAEDGVSKTSSSVSTAPLPTESAVVQVHRIIAVR